MQETDWERLANMTDAEACRNALADQDNPPLTTEQLHQFIRARDIAGNSLPEKYENLKKKRYKELAAIRGQMA